MAPSGISWSDWIARLNRDLEASFPFKVTPEQRLFLDNCASAAKRANHPFPDMAACEAALESRWGMSGLAKEANNLFGMKQHQHPVYGTLLLPTKEFIHDHWIETQAAWVKYPTLDDCFADRLDTLMRLAHVYPAYQAALQAQTPEEFVTEVSKTWSTDRERATKVILIYRQYVAQFEQPA